MIHPHTKLQYINDEIGYGVFASRFLPKGTITYVKDALELEVSPEEYEKHKPALQHIIEKYSYIDQRGVRIVSWDFGKYVNHCCNCNTISTGYGFEIAIRDILPGEEITDDYGLFNMPESFPLVCNHENCRHRVRNDDFLSLYQQWDSKILESLPLLFDVEQPLWDFMDDETIEELQTYRNDPSSYKSVLHLQLRTAFSNGNGKTSL